MPAFESSLTAFARLRAYSAVPFKSQCLISMSKEHNNTETLDDSAIYRLRWVADAMEAAKRYAEAHPDDVPTRDAGLMEETE